MRFFLLFITASFLLINDSLSQETANSSLRNHYYRDPALDARYPSPYAPSSQKTKTYSPSINDTPPVPVNRVSPPHSPRRLKSRAELNFRPGTERSIGMLEVWAPLAQNPEEGKVIYGDYRAMLDDDENHEFNLGLGYRRIVRDVPILNDGIAGINAWFDRRHTERDSDFNQITLGGEWKGNDLDITSNAYIPISDSVTHYDANPNASNAGFVGNQIVVNTAQTVEEEPLTGIDAELGYRITILENNIDAIRAYAGAYHFWGDDVEEVTGGRVRFQADVTTDISLGARYQYDDVRDSQGFLDMTFRFPWGNKKSFQEEGLYARLDESPERDIDIVANEAVTDNGRNKRLISRTTGQAVEVFHVDNTAAGGGDGSIDTPFNTLVAAQGAAGSGDIIYVHRGDGTSTGQNAGITLANSGQTLMGSGVNLTFDSSQYRTANGNSIASTVLAKATTAPLLTNGAGDGVTVTADNVLVSGLTVDSATGHGVYASNVDNLEINQVTSSNNTGDGFYVEADNTALTAVTFTNNTADTNGGNGFTTTALNMGTITNVEFSDNTSDNNTTAGYFVNADGTNSSLDVEFDNNTADMNTTHGFHVQSINDAIIGDAAFSRNTSTNNTGNGFFAEANNARSSLEVSFDRNTSDTNGDNGFYVQAANDSNISRASFERNTATNNTNHGVYLDDDSTMGSVLADLGGGDFSSSGLNLLFSNTGTDIRADIDGRELKAENNWWGVATGLAGGETTLEDASTIDASPFRTSAP